MLNAVFHAKGEARSEEINDFFIASKSPLYVGVIMTPSKTLWTHLKAHSEVVLEIDGFSGNFSIPYRIEVGENTIFFLRPNDGEKEFLKRLEKMVKENRRNV